MKRPERHTRSLRSLLLWMLIPAQVLVLGVSLWLSNHALQRQIDLAYDRSLLGALQAIDHNISTASGGLSVELPYLMLQFFELSSNNAVYYRILTEDGLADIGNQQLPLPAGALRSGTPVLYDHEYLGAPLRIAALARPMNPPLYGDHDGRVVVLVGEDRAGRDAVIRKMLVRSLVRDLIEVLIATGLIVLAVLLGVRPLTRLYYNLRARAPDDLSPIEATDLPREVQPLVGAVNQHVARHAQQAQAQRQFLDDASHQLRTPLAVLHTQLDYALREPDPAEARAALLAMRRGLSQAQRTAEQLLALARAREADIQPDVRECIVVAALAQEVISGLYGVARQKHLDISLDGAESTAIVWGVEWLIREALTNVVDNAIKYTPEGGAVVVSITRDAQGTCLSVQDSGPGMSQADIRKAGRRFRRGEAGKRSPGAGLGLAIVQTILQRHHGTLAITSSGTGCRVSLIFPPEGAFTHASHPGIH